MRKFYAFLILLCTITIYSEPQLKELRYSELVNNELFDDHGVKGASYFQPFKANTIFSWPNNLKSMTDDEKNEIKELINDDFYTLFNHYVEITEYVEVEWSEEKVPRFIRIYIQDDLLQYVKMELNEGDYFDSYYWVFSPFSSFKQRINCFLVWYYKTK